MDKKLRALIVARLEEQIEAEYDALALEALANVESRRNGPTEVRECKVVEPEPVPETSEIEQQSEEAIYDIDDPGLDDIDDDEPVAIDTSDDESIEKVIEVAQNDDKPHLIEITNRSEIKRLIATADFADDDPIKLGVHLVRNVGMTLGNVVNMLVKHQAQFAKFENIDLTAPSFRGLVQEAIDDLEMEE